MNKRIEKLAEMTLEGKMLPTYTKVEFDRMDLFLPEHQKQSKRIHDYVMGQKPVITEYQTMTGHMKLDVKEISGPFMNAGSLKNTDEALTYFYNQPIENLSTFEWLHRRARTYRGYRKVKAKIQERRGKDKLFGLARNGCSNAYRVGA